MEPDGDRRKQLARYRASMLEDLRMQVQATTRALFASDYATYPPEEPGTYLMPVVVFTNHGDLDVVSAEKIQLQ